ncbi:MAG: hypothetical protein Q7R59_00290 [bacterium]|nr:hypothetical protein [bacterium]
MNRLRHLAISVMALAAIAMLGLGVVTTAQARSAVNTDIQGTPSATCVLPVDTISEVGKVPARTVLVLQSGAGLNGTDMAQNSKLELTSMSATAEMADAASSPLPLDTKTAAAGSTNTVELAKQAVAMTSVGTSGATAGTFQT